MRNALTDDLWQLVAQQKCDLTERLSRLRGKQIHHPVAAFQLVDVGAVFGLVDQMRRHRPRVFVADRPDHVAQLVNVFFAPVQPSKHAERRQPTPAREVAVLAVLIQPPVARFIKQTEGGALVRRMMNNY